MIEDLVSPVVCRVAWVCLVCAARHHYFVAWVGVRSSPAHRCSSPDTVHMCSSRGACGRSRGGVALFDDLGSSQQLLGFGRDRAEERGVV